MENPRSYTNFFSGIKTTAVYDKNGSEEQNSDKNTLVSKHDRHLDRIVEEYKSEVNKSDIIGLGFGLELTTDELIIKALYLTPRGVDESQNSMREAYEKLERMIPSGLIDLNSAWEFEDLLKVYNKGTRLINFGGQDGEKRIVVLYLND